MNLTIISQLFYPELISTGLTLTELCEALSKKGFNISVIAGYPTIVDPKTPIPKKMTYRTIQIKRVWSTRFPKLNTFGKLLNHITFLFSLCFTLLFKSNKTPLLLLTNPPLLPLLMFLLYPIKRFNYSILVFDMYPETIVSANIFPKDHVLIKLWSRLNLSVYKRATHIITIGRCMTSLIKNQLPNHYHSKLTMIPIWCDEQHIINTKHRSNFKSRWGLESRFIVGYTGNMARFHDIETIFQAANYLKEEHNILFLFVGEGYKKQWAQDYVLTNKLSNCMFKSYVDRQELGALLDCLDVGLVSLCESNTGLSVPSKTMGLLAAGKPIIGIMEPHAEIALLIKEHKTGYVVQNNQARVLAEHIMSLYSNPQDCATFSKNSFKAMQNHFNLDAISAQFELLFKS